MEVTADVDVTARIAAVLRIDGTKRAMQYLGRWDTWGDVRARVEGLDAVLGNNNLGVGTKVGLITRNRPPHVSTVAALLSTSRCLVPITSISSDALIVAEVERLGIPVLVADDEDWERVGLRDACTRLGVLGIAVSPSNSDVRVVVARSAAAADDEKLPGVAVLMPTSGTTGPPKRIQYTYTNVNGGLSRIAHYAPATMRSLGGEPTLRDSVVLSILALAHVGGLWAVIQALAEGRRISMLDRFEPHAWAEIVEEHQAKIAALPPATLRMVLDSNIDAARLRSLLSVGCGTAPLDPDTAEAFTERFGIPVLTAYGATEFPGGLVGWSLEDYKRFDGYKGAKRGAAGRARPGITIKITDIESGEDVPFGTEGVVTVKSPQATGPTVDGWVRTNDLGRMDEDGFLWVLGRLDDAINRGGFKIVPQVVEKVLRDHPSVVDAGVTGIPDARLGHVPVAAVTVSAGSTITPNELATWVGEHLAKYQIPVEIRIVDDLPRTTSLKVSKDGLRALFADATS